MNAIRVGLGAILGGLAGLVGAFLLLNGIGYVLYVATRPSDQGIDTWLFFLSLFASPAAGVAGAVYGALAAGRRAGRERE